MWAQGLFCFTTRIQAPGVKAGLSWERMKFFSSANADSVQPLLQRWLDSAHSVRD